MQGSPKCTLIVILVAINVMLSYMHFIAFEPKTTDGLQLSFDANILPLFDNIYGTKNASDKPMFSYAFRSVRS